MRRGALGACLVVLAAASSTPAATFVVDSTADAVDAAPGNGICATAGGACTLRAAIQEANAFSGADVVQVPAGTYLLTIPTPGSGDEDASASGDLDVTDDVMLDGIDAVSLRAGATPAIRAHGRGAGPGLAPLPPVPPVAVVLRNLETQACFAASYAASSTNARVYRAAH